MDLDRFMATELDKEMMDPTASSTVSERSDPSCSKPLLRTSSLFELPNMLKSADTVMEENRSLWTLSSVGKLAIRLARQSFFLVTQFLCLLLSRERTGLHLIQRKWHHFMILFKKKSSSQHQCTSLRKTLYQELIVLLLESANGLEVPVK